MRTLEIGSLGLALALAACWGGRGEKPAAPSNEAASRPADVVIPEELIIGAPASADPKVARQQKIQQAQATGMLSVAEYGPEIDRSGSLDPSTIQRNVRTRHSPIRACYAKRLDADAGLEGTTTVAFAIGPDGNVAEAAGAGFDPEVDRCVADVIKQLGFPAPTGGRTVRVSYPFKFQKVR